MWNTPRHTCSSCSDMNRYLVGHTPQAVWLVMWDVSRKNTRTQCTHFCVLMCGVGDVFIPVTLYFSFPYPSSLPLMLPSFCLSSPSVEGQGYEDKHRITWLFLWALGLQKLPHSPASGNFLHHSLGEDIWDSLWPHIVSSFSVLSGCCVMSVNFMGWLWSLHFCFPIPDSSLSPSSSTSSRRSGGSRRRRRKQYYSSLECRIGLNLEP